jgi:hypothetical protein
LGVVAATFSLPEPRRETDAFLFESLSQRLTNHQAP